MNFNLKKYLKDNSLTIYGVAKDSGYGYTTLHQSFNKTQTNSTSLNLRDIDALAKAQDKEMWQVLRELEYFYPNED
ncbi:MULTISPECIES: transcriptional regulator [unclassified Lactococcus]|uniref:transcriptional regulator n=1 Tax=unclassified Lactococcus TaxID=2643510 RepID=UPI0011C8101C|nr:MULTISPECIES: transcriptional regulator [unclassified Lactococcus]MQW23178.1 transcriptional regulator [Lactococcus sp. dk101]TXK44229.1 transcriptional regulator [Lactococcus sp. dk310]TXK49960.1 transcriptional regulator [Lactococcus sp. dk322]